MLNEFLFCPLLVQKVRLVFRLASGLNTAYVLYLSREDATDADDDQDVKDSRSHDSSHTHVSLCDKHPWKRQNRKEWAINHQQKWIQCDNL